MFPLRIEDLEKQDIVQDWCTLDPGIGAQGMNRDPITQSTPQALGPLCWSLGRTKRIMTFVGQTMNEITH